MSPSHVPTKIIPKARAARPDNSIERDVSLTMGKRSSEISCRAEPAYARARLKRSTQLDITFLSNVQDTYPKIAACLQVRLSPSRCSVSNAKAGSASSRTPEFKMPIANKAPA